ncbi:hypothetical protein [uncultured Neptuniibacter sp.]|uniref:hypothetical protein n=1 Tax=uncultured Neptuniibacter sp. TaxID=502143 RepID=UPI00262D0E15|nr:hypothetical protein [uncultured Neptuniibacter sp.]
MKYKDVIYTSITDRIDRMLSSINDELETNGDNETLEACSDVLNNVTDGITEVYMGNQAAPCLPNLYDEINTATCFSAVEIMDWDELLPLFKIAIEIEKDAANGIIDLENDVSLDEEKFCLAEYNGSELPFTAFGYHNQTHPINSVAYIKVQLDNLERDIDDGGFDNNLLGLLLHFLSKEENLEFNQAYMLYNKNVPNSSAAESAMKMYAALQGRVIHIEKPSYKINTPTQLLERVSPADSYNQFEETLIIISELNHSNDILGTFLSMYHVIESFMFKIPIVNLADSNGGNLFSLRDLRRLGEAVKDSEPTLLAKLFKEEEMGEFWEREINGTKFKDIVSSEISLFYTEPYWSDPDCEEFLSHLNIKNTNTYADLCTHLNADKYAKMLYKVRCAIVHNKETELHLSYFNINQTIEKVLNDALIKPLLLLISDLITDKSSKVWYTGPELKLYQV